MNTDASYPFKVDRERVRPIGLLLALGFVVSACATGGQQTALQPAPDTVIVVDTVTVVRSDATDDLKQRIGTLQLRLLERDEQIQALQIKLDEAMQEAVRSMAKLRTLASRAEAASAMAEAEIAIEALRAEAGPEPAYEIAQGEQLMESSLVEFDNQNYGGSLYLADQAKSLAGAGQGRLLSGERTSKQPGEVLFAVPLSLRTVRRSNVRKGPGLGFEILLTLEEGTALVGRSYTAEWVRVSLEDGRAGWIFHNLVGGERDGGL